LFASCGSKLCCSDSNIPIGILLFCPTTQCSVQDASDTSRPQGIHCFQGLCPAWDILSIRSFHFTQVSKLFSECTIYDKQTCKIILFLSLSTTSCGKVARGDLYTYGKCWKSKYSASLCHLLTCIWITWTRKLAAQLRWLHQKNNLIQEIVLRKELHFPFA